ncbi:MAG TPA: amidase [Steroidobacteraceae bacterium]|jgi:aspartyl-tRNA(Asn)/glutamyl-tRNA(Gln) amidotransferase subunit A
MLALKALTEQLAGGRLKARDLIEQCLHRIEDPTGQGRITFLKVAAEAARAQADAVDRQRAAGVSLPPFAGVPIAIKDLFDLRGDVTTAGSRVLRNAPPAERDAPAVALLRAAGFIVIGRTNMTEFAFSGLGLNPHYGTPLNVFDRATGRIPGGSSSGAAVAIADDMTAVSLGTDTGGSCRIPAALNGLVGLKPTAQRVSRVGALPLSTTLDCVGPLARTVECCALLDAVLTGTTIEAPDPFPVAGLRLLLPTSVVLDDLDSHVSACFERALEQLARAGASISRAPLQELARIPQLNANGGLVAPEAYEWHRELLEKHQDAYDPRVAVRILRGREHSAADYLRLGRERIELCERVGKATSGFDAVVMPAVPVIAPPLKSLESDPEYFRMNGLMLRNPSLANLLDRCAISLPMQRRGDAPAGLMLMGEPLGDRRLLAIARGVEALLDAAG